MSSALQIGTFAALHWSPGWGKAGMWAIAVAALVALALSAWSASMLPRRSQAVLLVALRTASVALVVLAILQPAWVSVEPVAGTRTTAIFVDTSASMGIEDAAKRWQQATQAAAALGTSGKSRLLRFDDQVRPVTPGDLAALSPAGPTRYATIPAALQQLAQTGDIGAAVVISDGLDVGRSGADPDPAGDPSHQVAALGIPIHGVLVGDETAPDLVVAEVEVSPFAYARHQLQVAVSLRGHNLPAGAETTLEVSLDGEIVHRSQVPLAAGRSPAATVRRVMVQPLRVGDAVITARAVALANEATTTNNVAHARVRVLRDRVRVLHLAGHPSWDTRFLRSHLRADPGIDLVSFYIMVAQGGGFFGRAADTTLIEFPTQQLFEEALEDFDLVIFHDFQFSRFEIDRYLPLLRRYITRGGAFWIIGGRQALTAGGYDRTAMSSWLPVALGRPDGAALYRMESAPVALTNAGAAHPITRLREGADENARAWQGRSIGGHNMALSAKGGEVLLRASEEIPLLTVGELQRGRVAVLASDGLWTWAFSADAERRAELRADYHKLLERLRGWLLRAPEFEKLQLSVEAGEVLAGAEARVTARWIGGAPPRRAVLRWRVGLAGHTKGPWRPATWSTGSTGDWRWAPAGPGVWEVQAQVTDPSGARPQQPAASARVVIAVSASPGELRAVVPDASALQALADTTGGKLWRAPFKGPVPQAARSPSQAITKRRRELWSDPLGAALLIGLLSLEWLLRRRWGLA